MWEDPGLGGAPKPKQRRAGFDPLPTEPGARILQKNEGDWKFRLGDSEDGAAIVLEASARLVFRVGL